MQNKIILFVFTLFFTSVSLAQPGSCRNVIVNSQYGQIIVGLNENKKVSSLKGSDDDEPDFYDYHFGYDGNGALNPDSTMKNATVASYLDGYMIKFKTQETENVFFTNKKNQIYQWQVIQFEDGEMKSIVYWFYTYDEHGNATAIKVQGIGETSSSTIDIKLSYDLTKPSLLGGDVIGAMVEMLWGIFPTTNKNLLISWEYVQDIKVQDQMLFIGRNRHFTYKYDKAGKVIAIDALALKATHHFDISYGHCK